MQTVYHAITSTICRLPSDTFFMKKCSKCETIIPFSRFSWQKFVHNRFKCSYIHKDHRRTESNTEKHEIQWRRSESESKEVTCLQRIASEVEVEQGQEEQVHLKRKTNVDDDGSKRQIIRKKNSIERGKLVQIRRYRNTMWALYSCNV